MEFKCACEFYRQPRLTWGFVLVTIRYVSVIIASVCAVIASGELAYRMAQQVQGKPSADVGVVVYEHSDTAVALWKLVFPVLSFVLLFIIKRTLSKNSNLPYWVGIIVGILCALRYLFLLTW